MRKKSVRLASAALAACMMLSALPVGVLLLPGEAGCGLGRVHHDP